MLYSTKEKAIEAGNRHLSGLPDSFHVEADTDPSGYGSGFQWYVTNGPISVTHGTTDDWFVSWVTIIEGNEKIYLNPFNCAGRGKSPLDAICDAIGGSSLVIEKIRSRFNEIDSLRDEVNKCKSKSRPATTKSKSAKRNTNSRSRT